MAIIEGQSLMLFVGDGADNTNLKSIAYAKNHTLELSAEAKDASTKDYGGGVWSNSELGLMSWTSTTENLCSDTERCGKSFTDLFNLFLNRTKVKVAFGLQNNNTKLNVSNESTYQAPTTGWTYDSDNCYTGWAYITSLSLTATNGEKASFTATFSGVGPLVLTGDGFKVSTTSSGD